jgi:pimeloyl-ACP methyl ester carboxylesterase
MLIIGYVVAAVLLLPVAGLAGLRRHRQRVLRGQAVLSGPRAIAEGRFVAIGGTEQWLQLRGEDRSNPVLLVVHGGPGSPYSIFTPVLRAWEQHFTVVHWDRRGSGRTLSRSGPPSSIDLTFERFVDDGIEVAEFLQQHLGQSKVVLMAGSMGTLVGIPMVKRRPDLFSAYVGTDFYVNMIQNDALGHAETLARVRAAGSARAVKALEAIGGDPRHWSVKDWGVRMQHSMSTDPAPKSGFKLPFSLLLTKPDYTLRDVRSWLKGFSATRDAMFEQFLRWDARELDTDFEVPFFLFQGSQDVVTLTQPAVDYFAEVTAPAKALVLIEGASHFCAFTHPAPFLDALRQHVLPVASEAQPPAITGEAAPESR